MQVVDANGNVFGQGLEITGIDGKPKVPVINTDITIGTTAIIGGVVGRILFEGTGNVVQESSSFTYDDTLKKFTLTGPIGSVIQHTALTNYNDFGGFQLNVAGGAERAFMKLQPNSGEFKLGVTGSGYFTTFHTSGLERARIFQNGNFAVNTTTDSGFKFDVAGTIRSQSSLFISNPSFTMGGSITHSANATLVITGGPGAGGENITFGPSNRIFINAQQTRFPSGSVQMASTLTVGSTNATSTNMLLMQGSITAGSGLGRGIGLDTGLVQSAANDVLTALHVNPTFTVNNTLFHEAYWMRLTGSYTPASYTGNNNATSIDLSNLFTNTFNAIGIRIRHNYNNVQNGYGILLESAGFIGIAQTSLTSTNFLAGTTVIGSSVVGTAAGYTLHVTNNTNGAIKVGSASQGSEHLVISHSQAGSTFSSIRSTFAATGATMLIDVAGQNNLRLFGTGNVAINNSTDAGFKLDVNGTGRFSGSLTINNDMVINSVGDRSITWAVNDLRFMVGANNIARFFTTGTVFISTVGVATTTGTSVGPSMAGITASSATFSATFFANPQVNHLQTKMLIGGNDGAYGGNTTQGIGLWIYGGNNTTNNSYGNVVIAHDGTTARGNVLIGTSTSTGFKLEVNGNTKVTGTITATVPTANTYICNIGLAADQSIASGSDAQINFVDIDDTNNWYDPTTKRFTPTVAGYYHVDFGVWFDAATVSTGQYNVQIRKNASTVLIVQQPNINNGTGQSLTGSKLIYFNGTTDYIDFTAYQSTGVNRNLQTGASSSGTYASIFLLAV